MSASPAPYTRDDADQDAAHLAVLLDMLVTEECELSRTGMTEEQVDDLKRIGTLAWIARDIARRLEAGVASATARSN